MTSFRLKASKSFLILHFSTLMLQSVLPVAKKALTGHLRRIHVLRILTVNVGLAQIRDQCLQQFIDVCSPMWSQIKMNH